MKFNSTFWNNPLLLIFKNRNDVNQITGKSFIAMSLLYFIIVGLVIHSKNRKNIKVQ
ncbi:hypothetical protein [Staphylococcus pseudintermedius]|uniref:hypothetical protein n=1 Tax=Staphylococcus pseudintermedius TaxID=283734 RepID=UPI002157F18C|nr:hypothetical protein [Staphylococcus pseudintermedius]